MQKKCKKVQKRTKKNRQVSRPGFLLFVQKDSSCTKANKCQQVCYSTSCLLFVVTCYYLDTLASVIKCQQAGPGVATAKADVFSKNGFTVLNKLAKILKIFDRLEELKSRDACFSTKKLD